MPINLRNIPRWSEHLANLLIKISPHPNAEHQHRPELNDKVSLFRGDITTLSVDAIVNAANCSLLGGGGVDGAIHSAAGKQLRKECATLNGCNVGEAKITKGYNLPAKYVIHTVGTFRQDPLELSNSYKNSLRLMLQESLTSIAFPCISTGIYGYDSVEAAKLAIKEVRQFLGDHYEKVDRVIFCVYLDDDFQLYEKLLQIYFPVAKDGNNSEKKKDSGGSKADFVSNSSGQSNRVEVDREDVAEEDADLKKSKNGKI